MSESTARLASARRLDADRAPTLAASGNAPGLSSRPSMARASEKHRSVCRTSSAASALAAASIAAGAPRAMRSSERRAKAATEACSVRPFSRHCAASASRDGGSIESVIDPVVHCVPRATGASRMRPRRRS